MSFYCSEVVCSDYKKYCESPANAYFLADDGNKKRLVKSLMEKFQWENENLFICWKKELKIVIEHTKNPIQGNEVVSGSPQRGEDRTLLALLSQLTEYFKDHELYPEEEISRKERVPLDQAILAGVRKITNQPYLLK